MGKSSGDTSTVTQVQPWTSQQPYLERGFGEALGIYQTPQTPFAGPTYTPFSAQTETGIGQLEQLGGAPNVLNQYLPGALASGDVGGLYQQGTGGYSPGQGLEFLQGAAGNLPGQAAETLTQSARGDFVGANPYLDAAYQRGAEAIQPAINATFGGAGRTGSGAHAMSLGQGMADLATGIYGPAYESERARQQQAAGMLGNLGLNERSQNIGMGQQALPLDAQERARALQAAGGLGQYQLGAAGYAPAARGLDEAAARSMLGAGGLVEGKAGEILQDQISRHQFEQNERQRALDTYMRSVQGGYGEQGRTEQDVAGNPLAGAIGGGLAGAQLFPNAFGGFGGPIGGAILGGLLGL